MTTVSQADAAVESEEPSVHQGVEDARGRRISPWLWIATANFVSGMPYVVAATLSAIIAKNMGVSNVMLSFWTALLLLPWTFKPLWGPLVDRYWTKRNWMLLMQALLGVCLIVASFGMLLPNTPLGALLGFAARGETDLGGLPLWFAVILLSMFIMAIASATYDIVCDGFYMIALSQRQQAFFVGLRSTFWRLALITAGGILPIIAGVIQANSGPPAVSFHVVVQAEEEEIDPVHLIPSFREFEVVEGEQAILIEQREARVQPGQQARFNIRLNSAPAPGHEVVVVVASHRNSTRTGVLRFIQQGGTGLGIASGERLVFTHEDWDQPKTVTINTDAKITRNVAEEFRVTAGNIPLSWAVVLGFTGSLLIILSLYHMWALPYAKGDVDAIADRPPFYVPLVWLGLTIGIPFAALYFGAQAVGWATGYVAKMQVERSNARWEASVADARVRLEEIAALKAAAEAAAPAEERLATDESAAFEELPEDALPLVAQLDPNILDEERRLQQRVDRAMAKKSNVERGIVSAFNIFNFLIFGGLFALWMVLDPYSRNAVGSSIHYASNRSGIGFAEVFQTFFEKEKIGIMLAFILLFRLGESQIVRLGVPFLLDSRENGGLALSVGEVGLIYQTIGVLCLLVGGITGGYLISRHGLRKVIWPLVACMHLPNLLYVYLAYAQPEDRFVIALCVGVEQLGYGIGFASFMMYLIYAAQGNFKTSHYALCTGFMALGMLVPMSFAGAIQAIVDYPMFFVISFILVVPGVLLIPFMPLDAKFGRKAD